MLLLVTVCDDVPLLFMRSCVMRSSVIALVLVVTALGPCRSRGSWYRMTVVAAIVVLLTTISVDQCVTVSTTCDGTKYHCITVKQPTAPSIPDISGTNPYSIPLTTLCSFSRHWVAGSASSLPSPVLRSMLMQRRILMRMH